MGFDSRHLVLEFLADYRNLGIQQMTLVFFGKKRDPFLQQCINSSIDKVFVYHSKGTRLFWKEYEYDKLSGSIIELLFDTNDSLNISKNEINFSIKEPYYFLDLQQFDFKYLSVIALKEDDDLIGYTLLYGDRLITKDEYPIVALRRLYRNIVKNENQAKFKEFDEMLNNRFGYLKFENSIYVSDILSKYLEIDKKYTKDYEKFNEILLKSDFQEVEIKKYDNYSVHLLELNKVKLNTIDEIKYQVYDEFTLFYLKYKNLDIVNIIELVDLIKEKIVSVFPNRKYTIYKVKDNKIIILFTTKLLKKDINILKAKLKSFDTLDIRSTIDVPKKIDLIKLSNYLSDNDINVFDYDEYQLYRKQENTNIYLNADKTKTIVNVANNKIVGIYYENVFCDNLELDVKKYNCFKVELDKLNEITITTLKEEVKKSKIILICTINNLSVSYYKEKITELKKIGVSLLADSSIFMNFNYMELVKELKGIFINEVEINKLDSKQINLIIDMYLKQSKLVFINSDCLDKEITNSNNIYKIV